MRSERVVALCVVAVSLWEISTEREVSSIIARRILEYLENADGASFAATTYPPQVCRR